MQTRRLTGLVSVVLAGLVLGCSDRSGRSQNEADGQLTSLVQRAQELRGKVTAAGSVSQELRREADKLVADVRAWQRRTGRNDIRTTTDSTRVPATAAAARDDNGGDDSCPSCPGYKLEGDQICFLADEGPCSDFGDDWVGRVCVYDCISIGSGPEPGGPTEKK